MSFPELVIDRNKLVHNVRTLMTLGEQYGIQIHFITKALCAWRPMLEVMHEAGCEYFGDSRVENLAKINDIGLSHMLVRIPMMSEVKNVVRYADLSLNSDLGVIAALSDAAMAIDAKHGVILMVEMGDLREGFMLDEMMDVVGQVIQLPGVWLAGIGANFNCYGGIIPEPLQLTKLVNLAQSIRSQFSVRLPIVSGGNSGSLYMLIDGTIPEGINHLRVGEAFLIGRETSYGKGVPGLYEDVFTLRAEVVELRRKPSVPRGIIGANAFNVIPEFEDYGNIWRAILAVGDQDVPCERLFIRDSNIRYLGASSDHLLLDVTHAVRDIGVGDILDFSLDYRSLLHAATSPYVTKRFV
ncbi:MAG: alanine/ornithine racemase family PLP-dependent enzyme [Clostridiaceae bacterium]|jgi:predicted amino acid racemase|nr:alanine/ornithine racemase family PLP-dependent enzyme [Clostridiaceae bacterium]